MGFAYDLFGQRRTAINRTSAGFRGLDHRRGGVREQPANTNRSRVHARRRTTRLRGERGVGAAQTNPNFGRRSNDQVNSDEAARLGKSRINWQGGLTFHPLTTGVGRTLVTTVLGRNFYFSTETPCVAVR